MSRDRSLDEFLDESGSTGDGSEGESAGDGAPTAESGEGRGPEEGNDRSGATRTDAGAIEPTYGWSPAGSVCESCGATVESRWQDGGERRCEDCKEW